MPGRYSQPAISEDSERMVMAVATNPTRPTYPTVPAQSIVPVPFTLPRNHNRWWRRNPPRIWPNIALVPGTCTLGHLLLMSLRIVAKEVDTAEMTYERLRQMTEQTVVANGVED